MAQQDAWRAYYELALGLTETSRKKALKIAQRVAGKGGATAEQLQSLADDLVSAGAANREAMARMIKVELDRTLGRVGLATMDEVNDLTKRVHELERELRAAGSGGAATTTATAATATPAAPEAASKPAAASKTAVARKTVAKKTVATKTADRRPRPPRRRQDRRGEQDDFGRQDDSGDEGGAPGEDGVAAGNVVGARQARVRSGEGGHESVSRDQDDRHQGAGEDVGAREDGR